MVNAAVVDNSVIIAWAYPKQASEYTERLLSELGAATLHTAFIWPAEYGNAARTLVRRGVLSESLGAEMIGMLAAFQLKIDPTPPTVAQLYQIASHYDLTTYDAAYLELSLRLKIPLATKDAALAKAATAAGVLWA